MAATDHLLTTTRAVRKRLDLTRPVPTDLVLECLRVAVQAPAGGNIQRWRWLLVDDPELKAGLAGLYARSYGPTWPSSGRPWPRRDGRTPTGSWPAPTT